MTWWVGVALAGVVCLLIVTGTALRIAGRVKEGLAEFNRSGRRPGVLAAARALHLEEPGARG